MPHDQHANPGSAATEATARFRADPEAFWRREARRLRWLSPFTRVRLDEPGVDAVGLESGVVTRWFEGGLLNASANCIDRHLPQKADAPALTYETDEIVRTIGYAVLFSHVCRLANVLRARGVARGDRVAVCMGWEGDAVIAMLACARIGAVHAVISPSTPTPLFSARLTTTAPVLAIVSADPAAKSALDLALAAAEEGGFWLRSVIAMDRPGQEMAMTEGRDWRYSALAEGQPDECPYEEMQAGDPLCILFADGPDAAAPLVQTCGGFLVAATSTFEQMFEGCAGGAIWIADAAVGVAAQAYGLYAALIAGGVTVAAPLILGAGPYDVGRIERLLGRTRPAVLGVAPEALTAASTALGKTPPRLFALLRETGAPDRGAIAEGARGLAAIAGRAIRTADVWCPPALGGAFLFREIGADAGPADIRFQPAAGAVVDAETDWAGAPRLTLKDAWPGSAKRLDASGQAEPAPPARVERNEAGFAFQ